MRLPLRIICGHSFGSLVTLLLLGLCTGYSQPSARKVALVIGINKYASSYEGVINLKYAKADMDSLAATLSSYGYEVQSIYDLYARRQDIVRALNRYNEELSEGDSYDSFVLCFSGHGMRNKSINLKTYWLTYDTHLGEPDVDGIRVDHLLDYVRDIRAKRKLVLLDHCFSGDAVQQSPAGITVASLPAGTPQPPPASSPPSSGVSRGPDQTLKLSRNVVPVDELNQEIRSQGQGMFVIAGARNEAYECDSLRHGLFSYLMLQALNSRMADKDNDGKLSLMEFLSYLKVELPYLSNLLFKAPQNILVGGEGVEIDGWVIADPLPTTSRQDIGQRIGLYKETINRWYGREWITVHVKMKCAEALSKWGGVQSDSLHLDDLTRRILKVTQDHLQMTMDKNIAEQSIAESLNESIKGIIGG